MPAVLTGPALLLMALLLVGPLAAVVGLSLTDYQLGAPSLAFVGLENYREMAADRTFWLSLANTVVHALVVVPVSAGLGLGLALLVQARPGGQVFYRTVFFVPVMATLIAVAIAWEFLLHPGFGLVNLTLRSLGFEGHAWLQESAFALPVIATISIWQLFGFNMVLYLAGLMSIPPALYEAAQLDGAASAAARFRLVTWPLLGPVTLFVLVIGAIRAFQVFDTVAVLTKGGPNKHTEVLLYTIYAEGFEFFRSGYAAAVTTVFLVIVLVLALVKARVLEKRVHYQ
jgi:multiple sugar transport system permease protein